MVIMVIMVIIVIGHGSQNGHGGHGQDRQDRQDRNERQNIHSNLTFQVTCVGQLSQFLGCFLLMLLPFQIFSFFNNYFPPPSILLILRLPNSSLSNHNTHDMTYHGNKIVILLIFIQAYHFDHFSKWPPIALVIQIICLLKAQHAGYLSLSACLNLRPSTGTFILVLFSLSHLQHRLPKHSGHISYFNFNSSYPPPS